MKAYSGPEVLEDHIAPASISLAGLTSNDPAIEVAAAEVAAFPASNDIGNPTIPVNVVGDPSLVTVLAPTLEPDAPFQLVDASDFNVRTVGAPNDALNGISTFAFREALFQSLRVNTTLDEIFSDSTLSTLADELSISIGVVDAIESAVGLSRPAALVGLSSDEFERSPGSAFLTSLSFR